MARNFSTAAAQYLDAGTSALFSPGAAAFSLGLWLRYPTATPAAQRHIFCRGMGATAIVNARLSAARTLSVFIRADDGTTVTLVSTETIAADTWTNVCMCREISGGGQVRAWLDGVEVGGSPAAFAASKLVGNFGSEPFLIGRRNGATGQDWNGELAGFFWCNGHALSAQDAAELARGASPAMVLGANLTTWWPLHGTASPEPEAWSAQNAAMFNGPAYAEDPADLTAARAGLRRRRGIA